MSEVNAPTCPSCGARLPEGADVCDLCGTMVDSEPSEEPDASEPSPGEGAARPPAGDEAPDDAAADAESVYCNACGWENPSGARFCSQCGERLQEVGASDSARAVPADAPPTAEEESPPSDDGSDGMGRQVGLVVGVGLLLVVGLFLVTSWSGSWSGGSSGGPADAAGGPAASAQGGATGPGASGPAMQRAPASGGGSATDLTTLVENNRQGNMPQQLAARTDSLQSVIESSTGAAQQSARRELVNALIGGGRLGPAALAQRRIAETTGNTADWRRTGDLLYSWMETLGNQPQSRSVAQHVVDAYQKVLDQDPENLDVRTDMATAYLQTNNPMRGVEEINRVLEQDPDHFQARFNKGIMLTMIGRTDQAIEQFERVKEIVGSESPYYQQANQAIQTIREQTQPSESGSGSNPS